MGWAYCGTDDLGRDIGYGVPAACDHPGCTAEIDRGLGCVCGTMHGGENGCGRYFCGAHRPTYSHDCPDLKLCAAGEHSWRERDYGLARTCHVCGADEDELPCPDGQHKWAGKQMGGSPDTAEAAEWVGYCDVCGIEQTD